MSATNAAKSRKRKRTVSNPIPVQLQSPLLTLPGEIRNAIYQYAMEKTRPLHIVGRSEDELPTTAQIRRFHAVKELMHTCRQLLLETREYNWTHVSWSCEAICSPLKKWFDPVPVCPNNLQIQPLCGGPSPNSASENARILVRLSPKPPRMVVDRRKDEPDYYSIDSDMFDEHVRLCEAHPHLEVIVLSNSLRTTQGCRGLLVAGAAVQLILRGKRVSFDVDATFTSDVDKVARAMTTRGGFGSFEQGFRYPDNLKYFPQDSYNEAELRASQTEKKMGFENWLAQVREWYAHGI
ncbi:unnamed protein product [Alternaria alternata]